MKSSHNKWKGFTLVEIVAVIAIVGILSTVTIASLTGARENARNKNAVSTMQRLIIEASLYRANHSGYTNLCSDTQIANLITDIETTLNNTSAVDCNDTSGTGYEIQVALLGGRRYCVDSQKKFDYVTDTNTADHSC